MSIVTGSCAKTVRLHFGKIISRQGHELNVAVYSHADTLLSGTFAGLVVGGTLFMISLVGNIITMSVIVIFWRKVKE